MAKNITLRDEQNNYIYPTTNSDGVYDSKRNQSLKTTLDDFKVEIDEKISFVVGSENEGPVIPTSVTIDSELSEVSTNPIANKAVALGLKNTVKTIGDQDVNGVKDFKDGIKIGGKALVYDAATDTFII